VLIEHEGRTPAVVHVGSAVGAPAWILPRDRHQEIRQVRRELDRPGVVLGVPRGAADLPSRAAARYAGSFGRHRHGRAVG
jgi:hypothetical protein